MSFKDTQSYKELQSDWRWIHSMDTEAAAAADQWVKELHSAAPSGSWCGGQRQLSAANGSPV